MIFFSDFDGTLTKEGRELTPEFFEIIELIHKHKHELVIVSGRSISWGHFFLTHFPLKACIMEGGGVVLSLDKKGEIVQRPLISDDEIKRIAQFTEKIKHHYPHIPLSADSFGRLTDRAIEFHLMEQRWIDEVQDFMKQENVNYSRSNVHINFWCGEISKYLGVKQFMETDRKNIKMEDCWFFGDAPNDESMFEFFPNSVGVSNIMKSLPKIKHKPKVILHGEENSGPLGVLNFIKTLV